MLSRDLSLSKEEMVVRKLKQMYLHSTSRGWRFKILTGLILVYHRLIRKTLCGDFKMQLIKTLEQCNQHLCKNVYVIPQVFENE